MSYAIHVNLILKTDESIFYGMTENIHIMLHLTYYWIAYIRGVRFFV